MHAVQGTHDIAECQGVTIRHYAYSALALRQIRVVPYRTTRACAKIVKGYCRGSKGGSTVKNILVGSLVLVLGCGSPIDIKPDTSGNGGNGGAVGNAGNGGGGGDAGSSTCDCPTGDGSRLMRQYLVGDDNSRMETPIWYDKTLDLKCSFQSLPNGETRCVPPHIAMNAYFDAGCTNPAFVWVFPKGQGDCTEMPLFGRFDNFEQNSVCGDVADFTIYHADLADPRFVDQNTDWYVRTPDSCVMSGVPWMQEAKMFGAYKIANGDKFVKAVDGVGF